MGLMKSGFLKGAVLGITFFTLFSCQNGSDTVSPVNPRSRGSVSSLPGAYQQNQGSQSYFYTQAVGRIYGSNQYPNEFNKVIQDLLSPSLINLDDMGYVSPTNGVRLMGYVELDPMGRLIPGKSVLLIEIHDEYVGKFDGSVEIQPFEISIPATQGTANNGQVNLIFEDSLGSVTLNGQYGNGNRFQGKLSFSNKNGTSGRNLDFEIETCGFFRCQ